MTSRSLPIAFPNVQRQPRAIVNVHAPSLQAVIVVFIALFILFGWRHLILTLEIALTGREIQIKTEELEAITRHKSSLQQQISTLESPAVLAPAAYEMGFADRAPLYVPLPGELADLNPAQESTWQTTSDKGLNGDTGPSGGTISNVSTEALTALFTAQATP
jgi:hypothetical protein